MGKSSVATFSSIMVRWSELGVTGDKGATKVVRPSSDRGSRCTEIKVKRLRSSTNVSHNILSVHEDNPIAIYLVKPKSYFWYEDLDLQDCK